VNEAGMDIMEWKELGRDIAKIEALVSWGRDPRNIAKYSKGFKAEELQNFLVHYILPLSYKRVPPTTYRAFQRFVFIISAAIGFEITNTDIGIIKYYLTFFIKWFNDAFYQNKSLRLPACKYTIHGLLHIVKEIENWGPSSYYWQFPEVPM